MKSFDSSDGSPTKKYVVIVDLKADVYDADETSGFIAASSEFSVSSGACSKDGVLSNGRTWGEEVRVAQIRSVIVPTTSIRSPIRKVVRIGSDPSRVGVGCASTENSFI